MAQKDYVSRGQSSSARRNTTVRSKKKNSSSGVSPFIMAIAAVVLVVFAGGLWFITHHKKDDVEVLPGQKITNGLPPKPEERWRYIKELETRQPGVTRPTEPSAGGEVTHKEQLTNEQRQLLEQMQADMRQQPTQLSEVPWNERAAAPRQPVMQPQRQPPQEIQRSQPKPVVQPQPVQKHIAQTQQETAPVRQVPPKTQPAPVANEAEATRQPSANTTNSGERQFMVQCGSFKGADPAEKVRAQLAFQGFDSHITINNGWNRVVVGPLSKENAGATLSRLKSAGHTNCIRVAAGG